MPKTSYPYFEVLSMPCARSKACGPPVSSVGKCVVIGRIVRRFQPWEVTARRAGEDQRALQEGALFVRGWVVGVRSVVVSVAGGGATGMRHAHALRGTAGGLVTRSASLRAGLSRFARDDRRRGEAAAPPTQVENLRYREMENGLGRRQAPAEQGGRGTTKARRHEGGRPAAGMRLRRSTRPTFRGG